MNTLVNEVSVDAQMALHRAEIKRLNEERIARLPVATSEMVDAYCEVLRGHKDERPEWLNTTHRLDEVGSAAVAAAKAEHEVKCNTEDARNQITAVVHSAERIQSFRYRMTEKGVTFTVRGKARGVPSFAK